MSDPNYQQPKDKRKAGMAANEMELIIEWDGQHTDADTSELADQILGAIQQHTGEPIIRDKKIIGIADTEFCECIQLLNSLEV